MNGADIIAIIILATIVIAIVVYLLHWLYRHSSKDLSFVRTGFGGEKVVMGGGALVLPIVHDVTEVSMNTLRIEVRRAGEKSLITRNRMRIEVIVEFFVRVIPTPMRSRRPRARSATGRSTRRACAISCRAVSSTRWAPIAAQMTMEEIHEHRADYIRGVRVAGCRVADRQRARTRDGLADQSRPDRHQAVQSLERVRRGRHDAADRGDRDAQEEAQRHRAGHDHRHPREEPRSREARADDREGERIRAP